MGSPRGHSRGTHCSGEYGSRQSCPSSFGEFHPWSMGSNAPWLSREPARRMRFQSSRPLGAAGIPDIPGVLERRPTLSKRTGSLSGFQVPAEKWAPQRPPWALGLQRLLPQLLGLQEGSLGDMEEHRPEQPPPSCPWERCSGTAISPDSVGNKQCPF